jgi:hypothetical protein
MAGRAAQLTDDRRVTAGLHAAARALHADGGRAEPSDEAVPERAPDIDPTPPTGFSERELEIGRTSWRA